MICTKSGHTKAEAMRRVKHNGMRSGKRTVLSQKEAYFCPQCGLYHLREVPKKKV